MKDREFTASPQPEERDLTPRELFLASSEGGGLETPRRCRVLERVRGEDRDDYLLVEVDPPFPGEDFDLGGNDVRVVLLASRYREESLFPVRQFPVHVHVARLLVPYSGQRELRNSDIDGFAWGEVYPSEAAAREGLK